jgi:hypothetical protein
LQVYFWILRQTENCIEAWGTVSHGPFKGRSNLSQRNDFNQQQPETARIATLSHQLALMLQ